MQVGAPGTEQRKGILISRAGRRRASTRVMASDRTDLRSGEQALQAGSGRFDVRKMRPFQKKRVIIMGAAGRDFHNFNVYYRNNPEFKVVGFTADQIPDIAGRVYPPELAGKLYPKGISIFPESDLPELIRETKADQVVLAYSDLSHEDVMHKASIAEANGADFQLLGPGHTMLVSKKPVIAVCAVRTGCGKSQTTRKIASLLKELGLQAGVVRHPMPYGDLKKQEAQSFKTPEDLDRQHCTVEEREEYYPLITAGFPVYAGVDYAKILKNVEKENDVIIWDGGNNDFPFYKPDLLIVVADPHRPGHELSYHPGETNFRMADVIIINKVDSAKPEDVEKIRENIRKINPKALVIEADSPVSVDDPAAIQGKKALVIEDGPTLTHGGMKFGAGIIAARKFGAAEVVSPKDYAVGTIADTYRKYGHLSDILPAMGYSEQQLKDLEETINRTPCDVVINGSPSDLGRLITVNKPMVRVRYDLEQRTGPDLKAILEAVLEKQLAKAG